MSRIVHNRGGRGSMDEERMVKCGILAGALAADFPNVVTNDASAS